ncbi:hypothetical protein ET475_00075 [Microbacterium protaetiae]|uniref:Uncharacterized protein n=1 Tax=Microbacterium protaetiae TaxID=2509458 RepID=A0A4P6EAP2_9MICO|nr:hypothetical protein [Microbacterium protaetiae]QAY58556.1 hypothetical protein ET475_00075 [Microbacterium protaetiae]
MATREQKNRRNKALRIGAGALAILGIGAAITTAAWTDQVWFAAEADTGIALQGSLTNDPAVWENAPTKDGALKIELPTLSGISGTDDPIEVDVFVKNASRTDVTLADPTLTFDGELFTDDGANNAWVAEGVTATIVERELAKDAIATVTVTLDPAAIPAELAGTSGTYWLQVSGAAS